MNHSQLTLTELIQIRVTPSLKAALESAAQHQRMRLPGYLRCVLAYSVDDEQLRAALARERGCCGGACGRQTDDALPEWADEITPGGRT